MCVSVRDNLSGSAHPSVACQAELNLTRPSCVAGDRSCVCVFDESTDDGGSLRTPRQLANDKKTVVSLSFSLCGLCVGWIRDSMLTGGKVNQCFLMSIDSQGVAYVRCPTIIFHDRYCPVSGAHDLMQSCFTSGFAQHWHWADIYGVKENGHIQG